MPGGESSTEEPLANFAYTTKAIVPPLFSVRRIETDDESDKSPPVFYLKTLYSPQIFLKSGTLKDGRVYPLKVSAAYFENEVTKASASATVSLKVRVLK